MSTPVQVTCPTCQAVVAAESAFCTWCGVSLTSTPPAGSPDVGARRPRAGLTRRELRDERDQVAGGGVMGDADFPVRPAAPSCEVALGPAFDGVTPAGTGRRLGALLIDACVVWLISAGVLVLTRSPVAAALTAVELAAGLVIWEARTGKTLGNAALGLRAARVETPSAPGLGRSVGRGAVLAVSHVLPVVGPLLLVATTARDASGRRQGWHDKLSKTVVVDVRALRREARVEKPDAYEAPAVSAPAPEPAPPSYVVTLDTGQAMTVTGWGYVGRHPQAPDGETCDHVIEIDDPNRSLSRTHARFGVAATGFWIEDRGSANGTSIVNPDGSSVPSAAGQRLTVPAGGTVRLGDRTFTVYQLS